MGELNDKLHLSFYNHTDLLLSGLWRRYECEDGTDLVIACEGGEVVKAHRWIIEIFAPHLLCSPASTYYIELSIEKPVLKLILEYIYRGSINVCENDGEKVRRASEMLMLNHLVDVLDAANADRVICDPIVGLEVEISDREDLSTTPTAPDSVWDPGECVDKCRSDVETTTDHLQGVEEPMNVEQEGDKILDELNNTESQENVNETIAEIVKDSHLQPDPESSVFEGSVEVQSIADQTVNLQSNPEDEVYKESVQLHSLPQEAVQMQDLPQEAVQVQSLPQGAVRLQNLPICAIQLQCLPDKIVEQQSKSVGSTRPVSYLKVTHLPNLSKESVPLHTLPNGAIQLQRLPQGTILLQGLPLRTIPLLSLKTGGLQNISKDVVRSDVRSKQNLIECVKPNKGAETQDTSAKDATKFQGTAEEAIHLQGIAKEAIKLLGLSKETAPQQGTAKRAVQLQGVAKEAIKLLGLEKQFPTQQSKLIGGESNTNRSKTVVKRTKLTESKRPTQNDSNAENLNYKLVKRRPLAELKMRCVVCEFVGTDRYDFEQHILIDHPDLDNSKDRMKRRCTFCDFIAFHKQGLYVHLKQEHRNQMQKNYSCNQCEFVSDKKSLFDRHVRNEHSTDRPFRCDKCDYRGMTKTHLWIHLQTHTGRRYKCETCGKSMNSQTSLTKHRKLHLNPVFTCPLCSGPYRDKATLKKHLRRTHNRVMNPVLEASPRMQRNVLERIKCRLCDYSATNDKFLSKHLASQHQVDEQLNHIEPTVSCPDCDFMCHIHSQLTIHRFRVHKKYRKKVQEKVVCDECGNSYSSKDHMKRHKKMMHNSEAVIHMCHMCGFTTKTRGNLTQHLKRKHEDCI